MIVRITTTPTQKGSESKNTISKLINIVFRYCKEFYMCKITLKSTYNYQTTKTNTAVTTIAGITIATTQKRTKATTTLIKTTTTTTPTTIKTSFTSTTKTTTTETIKTNTTTTRKTRRIISTTSTSTTKTTTTDSVTTATTKRKLTKRTTTTSFKTVTLANRQQEDTGMSNIKSSIEDNCNCITELRWTNICLVYDKNNCVDCDVDSCMILESLANTYCTVLKCKSPFTSTTLKPTTISPTKSPKHGDKTLYIVFGVIFFLVCGLLITLALYKVFKKVTSVTNDLEMQVFFNGSEVSMNNVSMNNEN